MLQNQQSYRYSLRTVTIFAYRFSSGRQQRVYFNNHYYIWKEVNKGTIQGSVGGPYFFNIFLNDLETELNGIQSL